MNITSSNNMFEGNDVNWKVGFVILLSLLLFFILDIGNVSFLMSPLHFSFVPLILFIGAIKFPWLVTPFMGFILGLVTDILSYTPIGLMALMYFLTVFVCRWQHRFILAQPFYIIWLFFTGYLALFCSVEWVVQSIYHHFLFDIYIGIFVLIYGAISFPILWAIFFKVGNMNASSQENI